MEAATLTVCDPAMKRWVLLVPFDDPWRPVRVDTQTLRDVDCVTTRMLAHEAPHYTMEGLNAWNVNTTRVMLVAFVQSLKTREFVQPKDVSLQEAMRFFEYEGIAIPGNDVHPVDNCANVLREPPMGIGMRKPVESTNAAIGSIVREVAQAIMQWPRLEHGMNEARQGNFVDFACSPTRAWISFVRRPVIRQASVGDATASLASRQPLWLTRTLTCFGFVHYRMTVEGAFKATARDEKTFAIFMRKGVEVESLRSFISCKYDIPLACSADSSCQHAQRFAAEMVDTYNRFAKDPVKPTPADVMFARGCITQAEKFVRNSPDCANIFGGQCATPAPGGRVSSSSKEAVGQTPERRALEKELSAHRIRVIAWEDNEPSGMIPPIAFPPAFRSDLAGDRISILLEAVDR